MEKNRPFWKRVLKIAGIVVLVLFVQLVQYLGDKAVRRLTH